MTDKIVISAPVVSATSGSSTSITATWNTVDNVSGYRIECAADDKFTQGVKTKIVAGNVNSIDFTGLTTGTTYYVRVMAIGTGQYNDSEWSNIDDAKPVAAQLSAPAISNILGQGEGKIAVTWSNVDNADGYVIEYATTDSFADAKFLSTANGWASLTGFDIDKTYYFRVKAIGTGAYSNSDWSEVVSVVIADLPPVVQTVFRDTDKTATTVTLAWGAVNGATGYEIRYRLMTDPGSEQWLYFITAETSAVISGLNPGCTYEFQMKSLGKAGANSGWSTGIMVTTYLEAQVQPVGSSSIDTKLATIKGVKLDKKVHKPTQTTLSFTWQPATLPDSVTFDVLAPKPKHWAKKALSPCVATVTIGKAELEDILASGESWSRTTGDCTFTISAKVGGGFDIKVSGLTAKTKYRVNMQASDGTTDKFSKITKISASTTAYAAPKSAGKATPGLGTATFSWKQSASTPAGMDTGANREYTVGIWINKEFIAFGSGDGEHSRIVNGNAITITVTGRTAVVTGLASQKYVFGVQESVTVGDDVAKSAIAKISASPLKYTAPKVNKPSKGATTLTWTPVKTATEGQIITYVVGVYDNKTKEFKVTPEIIETAEHVAVSVSALGVGRIGVQELLWEDGNLVAKSAIKVITVK